MRHIVGLWTKSACLIVVLLLSGTASPQAQDIEVDFHFLKFGLSRKAVISMLGEPEGIAESRTIAIRYYRMTWASQDGARYNAYFFNDRLFRWKKCNSVSASVC